PGCAPSGREIGAGEGNRTLVISLEGCCSTIELHPRTATHSEPASALRAPARQPSRGGWLAEPKRPEGAKAGGGGRTRTYQGIASGFTVRPLCRSGHSPEPVEPVCKTNAKIPVRARISAARVYAEGKPGCQPATMWRAPAPPASGGANCHSGRPM